MSQVQDQDRDQVLTFDFEPFRNPPQSIEGLPGVYVSYPPRPDPFAFGSIVPSELFTVSVMPDSPSYADAKAAQAKGAPP